MTSIQDRAVPPIGRREGRTTPPGVGVAQRRAYRSRLLRAPVLLVDAVAVVIAAVVVETGPAWGTLIGVIIVGSLVAARSYRRRVRLSFAMDLPSWCTAIAASTGLLAGGTIIYGVDDAQVVRVVECVLLYAVVATPLRLLGFPVLRAIRKRYGTGERTIVVGASSIGTDLVQLMRSHPEFGLTPIGFVDSAEVATADALPAPVLGIQLVDAVRDHDAHTVVLVSGRDDEEYIDATVVTAHHLGVRVLLVPRMFELYHDSPGMDRLRSYPLVPLPASPTVHPFWWLKRAADVLVCSVGLVLAAPIIAAAAAAVYLESGRPILFRQERVGMNDQRFEMLKLRTMQPPVDEELCTRWSVAGDARIGSVGRFLRRTSLDELPQLWNVLRGDMSLVGPRPERPAYVDQFTLAHRRYWARHRVPAGLTGLAQVNGLRGDTSIEARIRYDNYYIASWTPWLDLMVLCLTLRELFRGGQH